MCAVPVWPLRGVWFLSHRRLQGDNFVAVDVAVGRDLQVVSGSRSRSRADAEGSAFEWLVREVQRSSALFPFERPVSDGAASDVPKSTG